MSNNEWHRQETYKSMISISTEGFKLLALLNGGAAAGILASFDKLIIKIPAADLRVAMLSFSVGLGSVGMAFLLSYLTQLTLFNEIHERTAGGRHQCFLYMAIFFCLLSVAAFMFGAYTAISDVK